MRITHSTYTLLLCFCLNYLSAQKGNDTAQFIPALPIPVGVYNVQTNSFFVVDSTRFDSVLNRNGREISFQVWLPTKRKSDSAIQYIPKQLTDAMIKDEYNNIDSFTINQWKQIVLKASSIKDFPASGKLPLLFFLHGFGMSRYSYISIIQDLVSEGYVVISLDSPHSGLMVTQDGSIINTLYDGKPILKCESMAKDVCFILSWLQNTNDQTCIALRKIIDFNKLGVLGHSLGGAAALEVCRINNRFKACADLDGDALGKVEQQGLNKPTLILLNEPLFNAERFKEPGSKEQWDSMGNERKNMWQNIFLINKNVSAYAVRILGSNHFTFTDFPFITIKYYQNPNAGIIIEKDRGLLIISSYIQTFFDHNFASDDLFDVEKLTKKFPETNLQLSTQK